MVDLAWYPTRVLSVSTRQYRPIVDYSSLMELALCWIRGCGSERLFRDLLLLSLKQSSIVFLKRMVPPFKKKSQAGDLVHKWECFFTIYRDSDDLLRGNFHRCDISCIDHTKCEHWLAATILSALQKLLWSDQILGKTYYFFLLFCSAC